MPLPSSPADGPRNIAELRRWVRALNWCVPALLLLGGGMQLVDLSPGSVLPSLLVMLTILVFVVLALYLLVPILIFYAASAAWGQHRAALVAIASIFPPVGVIVLILLNLKAWRPARAEQVPTAVELDWPDP